MPETAPEATTTADPSTPPMGYDKDKGMWLPDNSGNVINVSPVMTQTMGGETAPGTPRQIPISEAPSGPAGGEAPTSAPEQNGEVTELKQQIEELKTQLQAEQEERKRQQDEQTKAMKSLAAALKAQNKLLKELLEQRNSTDPKDKDPTDPKDKDPTDPKEPDPEEEERKRKEEEERKKKEEEEEEARRKKEQDEKNEKILADARDKARNKLLEIIIRRKGRMGDKFTIRPDRGQEDKELYDQAMEEYTQAIEMSAGFLHQLMVEGGITDPELIRQAITKFAYEEQTKLAEQEVTLNNKLLNDSIENSNVLTRPLRKFMRKWAETSTKKKLMIGLGLGVVVGLATGTAGLGVAVLAAGSAAKFSLGLMNRRASLMNASKNRLRKYKGGLDKEYQETMANILGDDATQLESRLTALMDSVGENTSEQIKKAQRRNKLGNALILASGLLMGLGAGGVELIPSVMDGIHHAEHAVENGIHHEHIFGGGGHHGGAGAGHEGGHGGGGHHGVENGGGGGETPPGLSHGESLSHYGDTIWYHAQADLANQLGRTPNNHEVWDATQQILSKNSLSWEQARHLPVNYDFSVPETLRT